MRQLFSLFFVLVSSLSSLHAKESELLMSPTLEARLKEHIHFQNEKTNWVGRIVIDDKQSGINEGTWIYVKKALDYYREQKPIFIILELNTPGGDVFAAQKISDAFKEFDTQEGIPVVTYINNWAISAGVMLAYSTRYITTVKDGTMGAAEPVIQGETGEMKTASEKINSALRADFASRARYFDRNPYIAEAMVDKDILLVLRQGQIVKLESEKNLEITDVVISPKGKLLTLNAEEMMRYGVADLLMLPEKLPPLTDFEKSSGKWEGNKMLLFKQPFFKEIPKAYIDTYQMDWKTKLFVFLNHPVVASLLVMGLLFGAYLEFTTPGVTLPGILAGCCLFLIALSSLALEIGNFLELILILAGIGVLIVDLFLFPTFGLLGSIGLLLFFAGLFGLMIPGIESVSFDWELKSWNAAGSAVLNRLAWICAGMIGAFLLAVFFSKKINPARFGHLVLTGHEQVGYIAADASGLPKEGLRGIAATTLRPSGKVEVDGKVFEAITRGAFIEKGHPVIIIGHDGSALVVREEIDV